MCTSSGGVAVMQMNGVNSEQRCVPLHCFLCILTREMSVHTKQQITSSDDDFQVNKIGDLFFFPFLFFPHQSTLCFMFCCFLTHCFHIMFLIRTSTTCLH